MTVEQRIHGYDDNQIVVTSDEGGELTLRVTSLGCTYRTMQTTVPAGEHTIVWDGLGLYGEPLPDGKYTIEGTLKTDPGTEMRSSVKVKAEKCRQAMLYALPSAHTLYLDDPDGTWFLQTELVKSG